MMGNPTCRTLFIFLLVAMPEFAVAQGRTSALNTVPSAHDVLGTPPGQLVWLRKNLQLVRDPVDGDLVFIDDAGKVVGRAAVPNDFAITKIEIGDNEVRFINQATGRQFVVPRNVAPDQIRDVTVTDVTGGRSLAADLRRIDARHLVVSIPGGKAIDVRSVHGGELTDAYPIGSDAEGNRYIVVEEVVSSSPNLNVRATIEKFNSVGQIVGIADVPLTEMDVVPRDFATVTSNGQVRVLFPTADGVEIRPIAMVPTKAVDLKDVSKITTRNVGRSTPVGRAIKVDASVQKIDGSGNFEENPVGRSLTAAPDPRARATIVSTAKSYLSVNWTLNPENWSHDGLNNICDKASHQFWLRPSHLSASKIGTVLGPMPYAWGGDDTPQSFIDKLTNQHALAGDVCTCRDSKFNDCVFFPKAAGVDCSGFVSRAWGVAKLVTCVRIASPVQDGYCGVLVRARWAHSRSAFERRPGAIKL
jgi:cell wall-associated NlpC family hydrolase